MSDIKRWTVVLQSSESKLIPCVKLDVQGEYVRYEDHESELMLVRDTAASAARIARAHYADYQAAQEDVERLRALIVNHNKATADACQWMQENRGCKDYIDCGQRCPECSKDWAIDFTEKPA